MKDKEELDRRNYLSKETSATLKVIGFENLIKKTLAAPKGLN